jgi:small subunit ribosomal protein S17
MIGTVVSTKMTKAIVIMVETSKMHPKYNKRVKSQKRYSARCVDSSKFALGQVVEIRPVGRKLSATISHVVVE